MKFSNSAIGKMMPTWFSSEWITVLTSSSVTAALCAAAAFYLKAKLEKSIQHGLNIELEKYRADLRSKEEQISALRNGALSGLVNRQTAIDSRRLLAIEKLWTATFELSQFRSIAKIAESLDMATVMEASESEDQEGHNIRKFADTLWSSLGIESLKPQSRPDSERPFLSPLAWALFSAYRQVVMYPTLQLLAARSGIGKDVLRKPESLIELAKQALPNKAEFIERQGVGSLPFLVDDLHESLLVELKRGLNDPNVDQENLARAAEIMRASNKIVDTNVVPHKVPEEIFMKKTSRD